MHGIEEVTPCVGIDGRWLFVYSALYTNGLDRYQRKTYITYRGAY